MVGYVETLTDPSYRGQIVCLTYPLIGNYGVPDRNVLDDIGLPTHFESDKIQVAGLIVQEYSGDYSHWNASSSLGAWLKEQGVPAITGVDTRLLTKRIRDKGAMLGRLEVDGAGGELAMQDPNTRNLVDEVSIKAPKVYGAGNPHKVLAVDCGMKNHIVRELVQRGAEVKVVPWDHDLASERDWCVCFLRHASVAVCLCLVCPRVLTWTAVDAHLDVVVCPCCAVLCCAVLCCALLRYDGLFISNGPGDPAKCEKLVMNLRGELQVPDADVKPVFGICMGNLITGLAAGAPSGKLKFGNRGHNQPVIDERTNQAYVTSQNHGFAIDASKLSSEWEPLFTNCNDSTNEGIMHTTRPYFTAQFHPEATGGPEDTRFLFDTFMDMIKTGHQGRVPSGPSAVSHRPNVSKVLVLGSGGLSIGQAGEFDYSGSQAVKALKEEGVKTVLVNPNIASVQTNEMDHRSEHQADTVYFMPVTADFITEIIKREKPDGILCSMGGQTALNVGVELYQRGVFEEHGVQVLGTPIDVVMATEDRDLFSEKLHEINEKLAASVAVSTVDEAVRAAQRPDIGFPCMVRSAYALGGLGSGICKDEAALRAMAKQSLTLSPQILVEKSMLGWKEVEYEVVRDAANNCVTVCNMENFDALGVHTGESVVIAPSQTLSDKEYHMLRTTAVRVIQHLGIVGECNIQYALNPHSLEYCIIEVNARLSRSSALASKATGYPLAAVAAKLGMGLTLPQIRNAVTQSTAAFFEPSLDYVVTKVPRWDLAKFDAVSRKIGSQMKSVGEVMAIGRTFEESLQKALRMTDPSVKGFSPAGDWCDPDVLAEELVHPTPDRMYAIADALYHQRLDIDGIHAYSDVDRWFLQRCSNISAVDRALSTMSLAELDAAQLRRVKQLGFSDVQIAERVGATEAEVRARRKDLFVTPHVKKIDTLAAEFPAQTNYLYTTYHGSEHDLSFNDNGIVVLGSGTYRIGSSVEFDWCSVSVIRTLRALGYSTTVINYNPETVSTDYDESDRLYFEELSLERVLDIYDMERPAGVIVSVGGQIPNNLALPLHQNGVKVLGTSPEMIDNAEDRHKFSKLMDDIGVQQPEWTDVTSHLEARNFCQRVGYPVLVRPSYVLSGAAMKVVYNDADLSEMLDLAGEVSQDKPVVITKYAQDALEIEFDGVAKNGKVVAHAVAEHLEKAGVHSGDASLVLPPQSLSPYYITRVKDIAAQVAEALNISGPFNMQLLAEGARVSIIETNVRASRSLPFVSKTIGVDMCELATRIFVDEPLPRGGLPDLDSEPRPTSYVGVKSPMFSFTRLGGADPVLSCEMASTGEVACYGDDLNEAYLKSIMGATFRLPKKNILLTAQSAFLDDLVHPAHKLARMGYKLYATAITAEFLQAANVDVTKVHHVSQRRGDGDVTAVDMIKDAGIDMVVNLHNEQTVYKADNYEIRRAAVDFGVPLLTNDRLLNTFANAMEVSKDDPVGTLKALPMSYYYRREEDANGDDFRR